MKNCNRYEINYIENTIIVSKKFLKEASIFGSTAYNDLARVRKELPDFKIIQREITKKPGKKTYGKLTYKVMDSFIEAQEGENAPAVKAEFEHMKKLSQIQSGSYAFVKKWFLERYKDVFKQSEETAEVVG